MGGGWDVASKIGLQFNESSAALYPLSAVCAGVLHLVSPPPHRQSKGMLDRTIIGKLDVECKFAKSKVVSREDYTLYFSDNGWLSECGVKNYILIVFFSESLMTS